MQYLYLFIYLSAIWRRFYQSYKDTLNISNLRLLDFSF